MNKNFARILQAGIIFGGAIGGIVGGLGAAGAASLVLKRRRARGQNEATANPCAAVPADTPDSSLQQYPVSTQSEDGRVGDFDSDQLSAASQSAPSSMSREEVSASVWVCSCLRWTFR